MSAPISLDGKIKLRFATVAGKTYRVETMLALGGPNWTSRGDLVGNGTDLGFSEATAVAAFYRVILLP